MKKFRQFICGLCGSRTLVEGVDIPKSCPLCHHIVLAESFPVMLDSNASVITIPNTKEGGK